MTAARCDLTELYVDQCAHCRPTTTTAANAAATEMLMGPWFPAAYPGECNHCLLQFEEGDQIRASEDGWVAECCGQVDS